MRIFGLHFNPILSETHTKMDGNAVVLTNGHLTTSKAKTAHGLIRGTERYTILGVIDHASAGKDAGEVLDGTQRGIPVYASLQEAIVTATQPIHFLVVGVATKGGVLPDDMRPVIREAIEAGISVVSGLHEFLSDSPEFVALAEKHHVKLIDVRKPKKNAELHFWTGAIAGVKCPKIAVLGTDCNMGKRTTARFLKEAIANAGLKSAMIYTGQTGWMQGGDYGFIFDSTLNDFISGELEYWMVKCYQETRPDVIFLEGQSSLRNPSGPCGSEFLISGDADAVILQHAPTRQYFQGCEGYKRNIPTLANEIALIKMYGVQTIAVTLNTARLSAEEALFHRDKAEQELGIPVVLPLEDGLDRLAEVVIGFIRQYQHQN